MAMIQYQRKGLTDHPMEDYCLAGASGRSFAVADGISRAAYPDDLSQEDDGAFLAARLFCETVIPAFESFRGCPTPDQIQATFLAANDPIHALNQAAGIIDSDYVAAVGAAAFLCQSRHLHFGVVGDCRIVVQAADGATTLQTADQVAEMKAYLHASGQDHLRRSRRALHTQVRNNLDFRDAAGRLRGYGAFTGEPGVSAYWRVGMIDVQEGDVLALFTDGVAPYVDMPEFTAIVRMFVGDRNHSTCAMQLSRLFDRWSGREGAEFRDDKALIVVAL